MIPSEWLFSCLRCSLRWTHTALFGETTENPWMDQLLFVYQDEDHFASLVSCITSLSVITVTPMILIVSSLPLGAKRQQRRRSVGTTLAVFVFFLVLWSESLWEAPSSSLSSSNGIKDMITGTNQKQIQALLDLTKNLQRGPKPPILLRNRHLQFVPWMLQNLLHYGLPFERLNLTVTDCIDKSELNCQTHDSMNDTITLDIFPPFEDDDNSTTGWNRSAPAVLFSPGLRCHSQDLPGNTIIRTLYGQGFRSIVVNRRGHTPGATLKAPRWNLFGDVDDLEQAYWLIKKQLLHPNTPVFLHGVSSGTAVLVTALSQWDERLSRDELAPTFVASVAVTPGYDISKVLLPERFQWPYNPLMNQAVKDHFLISNEAILRAFNESAYKQAIAAQSLQELLNASAVFAGYPDAESYFRHVNPVNNMHHIDTPVLVLNSVDDPCCRIENLYETSTNSNHGGRSYAELVSQSLNGIVAVTETGSHCPFLDGGWQPFVRDPWSGGWMLNSWADQSIVEYYQAALQVFNDRRFL